MMTFTGAVKPYSVPWGWANQQLMTQIMLVSTWCGNVHPWRQHMTGAVSDKLCEWRRADDGCAILVLRIRQALSTSHSGIKTIGSQDCYRDYTYSNCRSLRRTVFSISNFSGHINCCTIKIEWPFTRIVSLSLSLSFYFSATIESRI